MGGVPANEKLSLFPLIISDMNASLKTSRITAIDSQTSKSLKQSGIEINLRSWKQQRGDFVDEDASQALYII